MPEFASASTYLNDVFQRHLSSAEAFHGLPFYLSFQIPLRTFRCGAFLDTKHFEPTGVVQTYCVREELHRYE